MLIEDQAQIYWGTNGFLPFPKIKGLHTVLTVHDLAYFFSGKTIPLQSYWGRKIFQPWSVKAADRLISVSESTAEDIKKHYHRVPDAIVKPQASAIFKHVPENEKQRVRKKLNLPDRYFLSLGTLEPRKNLEALVKAYRQQKTLHADLPQLLMVGASGWKNSAILEAVKRGEEAGVIRRLGYVSTEDLPAIYALCEAYLMPSLYEGFGMPLLEAQLCGAPVVHGPHPSMHEAAGHLGTGCGVDETSLRAMFSALDAGTLPLTCRMQGDFAGTPDDAAREMWEEFHAATKSH
jgi:glycosyltransferase involved in cell wall biosynthesis